MEPLKREPWAEAKQIVDSSPSCLRPPEVAVRKKRSGFFGDRTANLSRFPTTLFFKQY